jgi:hypothetical protein
MNDPTAYSWRPHYLAAMLETHNALMSIRIYEALAAIEQRRPSLIATDGVEERAMEDAQKGASGAQGRASGRRKCSRARQS